LVNIGGLWLKTDEEYRPPCPITKSDSAIHSLFFSSLLIAAWLRLQ